MPRHAKPQKIGKGRRKARSCDSSDWKVQNGLEAEAEVPSLLEETVLLCSQGTRKQSKELVRNASKDWGITRGWTETGLILWQESVFEKCPTSNSGICMRYIATPNIHPSIHLCSPCMIIYCTTLHCVPFPPISHVQTISQAPNICALCCCNHHIIKISVALQFAIPSRTNAAPTHRMYSVTFSWNTPHTRPNSPIYDNLPSLCLLLQGWGQTPFIDSFQSLGVGLWQLE